MCYTFPAIVIVLSDDSLNAGGSTVHGHYSFSKDFASIGGYATTGICIVLLPTSKCRADNVALVGGLNTWPKKERQSNWKGPKVLALIGAKEKEYNAQWLSTDAQDNIEPMLVK